MCLSSRCFLVKHLQKMNGCLKKKLFILSTLDSVSSNTELLDVSHQQYLLLKFHLMGTSDVQEWLCDMTASQICSYSCPHICKIDRSRLASAMAHLSLQKLCLWTVLWVKLCSLCFGAITFTGPVYLSDLLKIYTPSRQLRSSADICIMCIPAVNTKSYGERSFSYSGPTLWNTLPKDIRFSQSVSSFRSALKTHLFPT